MRHLLLIAFFVWGLVSIVFACLWAVARRYGWIRFAPFDDQHPPRP